jgi:hypothetical protein
MNNWNDTLNHTGDRVVNRRGDDARGNARVADHAAAMELCRQAPLGTFLTMGEAMDIARRLRESRS